MAKKNNLRKQVAALENLVGVEPMSARDAQNTNGGGSSFTFWKKHHKKHKKSTGAIMAKGTGALWAGGTGAVIAKGSGALVYNPGPTS